MRADLSSQQPTLVLASEGLGPVPLGVGSGGVGGRGVTIETVSVSPGLGCLFWARFSSSVAKDGTETSSSVKSSAIKRTTVMGLFIGCSFGSVSKLGREWAAPESVS